MADSKPQTTPTAPWHEFVADKLWRYLGTLFMDKPPGGEPHIDFGRLSATLLMAQAMILWRNGGDISPTMMTVLQSLLAYNLGTKGVSIAQAYVAQKRDAQIAQAAQQLATVATASAPLVPQGVLTGGAP